MPIFAQQFHLIIIHSYTASVTLCTCASGGCVRVCSALFHEKFMDMENCAM